MSGNRPLNDRQLAVLRRTADGDLAQAPNSDKRSAAALHDRGLVVVRRSPWRASITDAGLFYLDHGRYPDGTSAPATLSARRTRSPERAANKTAAKRSASSDKARSKPKRPPPDTTARISADRRAAAEQLVKELVDAGEKVIRQADDAVQTHWRQVVDFAKRNQLVPAGKRIEKTRNGWGELRIRLLSGPHPNSRRDANLPSVPMPTELRDLHPVVKTIQDDSGRLSMGASLRHRSLLYLHGLTQEAVRRGYAIQEQPIADQHRGRVTTYGRPGAKDYSRREAELNIVVNGFSYRITIDQQHPEAEDDERYDRLYVWVRGPGHPYYGCRTHWRDGKRASIGDSIGSVLGEIETWAAAARREADDRQARWQAAMDEATRLATHDRLVAELESQVRSWRLIQDLRQYCQALEVRIEEAGEDEPVDEAQRWLLWARRHAEIMDPLFQLPTTPTPQLEPEELEPYLKGWSSQGRRSVHYRRAGSAVPDSIVPQDVLSNQPPTN